MARRAWLLLLLATIPAAAATLSPARVSLNGLPAEVSREAAGACLAAGASGPQALFDTAGGEVVVALHRGEQVTFSADLGGLSGTAALRQLIDGKSGRATLRAGDAGCTRGLPAAELPASAVAGAVSLTLSAPEGHTVLRVAPLSVDGQSLPWRAAASRAALVQPMPEPRPAITEALVEIDWRRQDGVGTPAQPRTWAQAAALTIARGTELARELGRDTKPWQALASRADDYRPDDPRWPLLWREAHRLRRDLALTRLAGVGPLAFVKQSPGGMFSHQLTQYYGSCAIPGGGLFTLDRAGAGWSVRRLAGGLPLGSFQHLDVSYDGRSLLFSYCPTDTIPRDREERLDRNFSLYRVDADGSGLRRLTSGEHDDFAPRWLPNGQIVFVSTRRGGYHRCGRGPCAVYTLSLLPAEGAEPRVISFHETHEWDPAVLNDGRLAYTRWDYVDRSAVQYQQLWTARPDGSGVSILYGNHTLNPTGVWEARAIPGSQRIMATAAAHHAMTAGSIVLVDPNRGIDGLDPVTRLTPDVPFPESETRVLNGQGGAWGPNFVPAELPADALRWPGSSYRSPWPLSERAFIAAYSYDPLIGEPMPNPPNQFGLYLVDAAGNKELLYRDLNLSSLWPMPLAPRPKPPALPSATDPQLAAAREGSFLMQNVRQAWPQLPTATISRLRIVQVLPKTTPHANDPTVGLANASPGKQVLGTVPVEADGSAYFRAPAGIPLAFQALDEQGRAVQTMRSLTYLQPGETATCIGCHERRTTAPGTTTALAGRRAPSIIAPAPDGSKPLNYARLVQPVLDRQCVSCHTGAEAGGKVRLTAEPEGAYTVSYLALAPRVPFSSWGGPQGNFEPVSPPDSFGARASGIITKLLGDHHGVKLTADDRERLFTWADANALFYGTFNRADQERQRRGELIAGPGLE
ncbi:MAG: PD40 domain-containing protein [Armatimonadetes bacterium]|nr:PD40 domain-containing protein [Armatimonadota bacterium]